MGEGDLKPEPESTNQSSTSICKAHSWEGRGWLSGKAGGPQGSKSSPHPGGAGIFSSQDPLMLLGCPGEGASHSWINKTQPAGARRGRPWREQSLLPR